MTDDNDRTLTFIVDPTNETKVQVIVPEGQNILFIDPLLWNMSDLAQGFNKDGICVVRRRPAHYGSKEKGFYFEQVPPNA